MRAIAKIVKVQTGRCTICGQMQPWVYLTRFEEGTQLALCRDHFEAQVHLRSPVDTPAETLPLSSDRITA